jgi:signal peptide peptidase SppA
MTKTVTTLSAVSSRDKPPATRVLERLHALQWAILPETLATMHAIAARVMTESIDALEARLGRDLDNTRTVTMRDGVATIPLHGAMFRYADFFSRISGATSYQDAATDFGAALDDPTVKAIVLDIDSPGGEVNGCSEFATLVADARGRKPIVAYVSHLGASAAYWIASAADEIVVSSTSLLGSIGCVLAIQDTSERDAARGIRTIEFVSSQTPDKRIDPNADEGRKKIQALVDSLAAVFIADVATYRGVTADDVVAKYGRGGILVGQAAVDAGLADRLGTYEALLAELRDRRAGAPPSWSSARSASAATDATPSPSKERSMDQRKRGGAAATVASPPAVPPGGTPTAAAFAAEADVKSTVAKDVTVAAGDPGTIEEVRDGTFYSVDFGNGVFSWMAEDELEADPETDSSDPEPDDTNASANAEKVARRTVVGARTATQLRADGATAERERILAIQKLGRAGEEKLIAECISDPACTPNAAALKLREAEAGQRSTHLAALAGDETKAKNPKPAASATGGDATPSAAASVLAVHDRVNPRRRRGTTKE